MLGLFVVVAGGLFVFIGANALVGDDGHERPRRRIPGASFGAKTPSLRTRRVVGTSWAVLGLLFIVAALTHQVP